MAEQTTAQRIAEDMGVPLGAAQNIAAEIDGLRAEVERLKPAAEAWETLEAFREAGRTGTEEDEDAARSAHKAARDRARAAKERK